MTEKILDDPRDDAPKPNGAVRGRPAGSKTKRTRRNYAAEYGQLESNVRVALILIRKAAVDSANDGPAVRSLLETAVELLEAK